MDWIRNNDNALFDRFISTDIAQDTALLTDIIKFCSICFTLMVFLERLDAFTLRQAVSFIRRKWLLRIASYTGPHPKVTAPALPAQLTAELESLGLYRKRDRQPARVDLSDQFIRHIAYRILKDSLDATGPVEEVLGALSAASRNPLLSQSFFEISLAGYANTTADKTLPWIFALKIRIPTGSEVNWYVSEGRLPADVFEQLFDLIYKDEVARDSTKRFLNAA